MLSISFCSIVVHQQGQNLLAGKFAELDPVVQKRRCRNVNDPILYKLCYYFKLYSPPLIKRSYIPDGAHCEDTMLVHGNDCSQLSWCRLGKDDRVGGAVALKDL
jgi:hypothetical protein